MRFDHMAQRVAAAYFSTVCAMFLTRLGFVELADYPAKA